MNKRGIFDVSGINNKVDALHVRLTELHSAHQNLPFLLNRALPLKQYQYQGRLLYNKLQKWLAKNTLFTMKQSILYQTSSSAVADKRARRAAYHDKPQNFKTVTRP